MNEIKQETKNVEIRNIKPIFELKPNLDIDKITADEFVKNRLEKVQTQETKDIKNIDLKEIVDDYINDLVDNAEYPETIDTKKIRKTELVNVKPEDIKKERIEFARLKPDLIKEWENKHNKDWPKYTAEDIKKYNLPKNYLDRLYDCHHEIPLFAGGKNEVDNITPMRADKHNTSTGIHAKGRPCSQMMEKLRGE